MAKTKEEKAAEKAAKDQFATLKKDAKKLKIDFDKNTTQEELQVLVDAANAAATAQEEKAAADGKGFATSQPNNGAPDNAPAPTGTEDTPVPQAPPVAPADPQGDRFISKHTTRGGDVHNLVQRGNAFVVKDKFGVVSANFATLDEGKHHMENLSRF